MKINAEGLAIHIICFTIIQIIRIINLYLNLKLLLISYNCFGAPAYNVAIIRDKINPKSELNYYALRKIPYFLEWKFCGKAVTA